MAARWKLFDFDAEWDRFWAVFSSDEVQTALVPDMEKWCREHAWSDLPMWTPGTPLWKYSRTDHWVDHIEMNMYEWEKAQPSDFESYKQLMERKGLPHYRDLTEFEGSELHDRMTDVWFERYTKEAAQYDPKPGTLESCIMIHGKNFLTDGFALAARRLFPHSRIFVSSFRDADHIWLPDERILFDIYDFYFSTRDGSKSILETRNFREHARNALSRGTALPVDEDGEWFIF